MHCLRGLKLAISHEQRKRILRTRFAAVTTWMILVPRLRLWTFEYSTTPCRGRLANRRESTRGRLRGIPLDIDFCAAIAASYQVAVVSSGPVLITLVRGALLLYITI